MKLNKYIAVAGNVGSGKSTLVKFLASQYGIQPFYEPNDDNPYLADFYANMKAWAFHSQVFFLTHKFRIHQELGGTTGTVVLDRTIYEDAEIFATALHQARNMSKRDFTTYWSLYQSMCTAIRPPDLMIYLKCPIRSLRKRIEIRGRAIEKDIPVDYLRRLQRRYDDWISSYKLSQVITIETDKMDYLSDLVHRLDVMRTIEQHLKG